MAKILVADDNSNVQKTVALALTDLGVEVVAVNNGDAAIKKMDDISPDLVLADIFMPVRNGYEVCEFVKKNSRFMNVPVVLLVGAFDPLDEREAQRVGADGILKKPFVPPDPLMTMVKTLLERSMGGRLASVPTANVVASVPAKSNATMVAEPPRPVPVEAAPSEELAAEELPAPISPVKFGEGEHPVAFSQLLDASAQAGGPSARVVEPVDDEQVLTGTRDSALGEPAFWNTPEPEEEAEPENSEEESKFSDALGTRTWVPDEEPLRQPTEEALPSRSEENLLQPADNFELVQDDPSELTTGTPTVVDSSSSILEDPATVSRLNVNAGKADNLAANPLEWMATAPPSRGEEETEPEPELREAAPQVSHEEMTEEPINAPINAPIKAMPPANNSAPVSVPAPVSAVAPKPPSPPLSVPVPTPVPPPAAVAAAPPEPIKPRPTLHPVEEKPEDTARSIPLHDWTDLAASIETKPVSLPAQSPTPADSLKTAAEPGTPAVSETSSKTQAAPPTPAAPASPASPASAAPDPALVDAVVQRVLDKMKPQVVDIITKEFLRPIVQALVHREIEKQ